MSKDIVNRVSKSPIVNIDLEVYWPKEPQTSIDISQWLENGYLVREKPFRSALISHDWNQYKNHYIRLFCSTEAVLPGWTYLLVSTYLHGIAKFVVQSSEEEFLNKIYTQIVNEIDMEPFRDKPIMVSGCGSKEIPQDALVQLVQRIQKVARSVFFGEACSNVPLWKKRV